MIQVIRPSFFGLLFLLGCQSGIRGGTSGGAPTASSSGGSSSWVPSSGSPDPAFGVSGQVNLVTLISTAIAGLQIEQIEDVYVAPDDSIYASVTSSSGGARVGVILKLTANGVLDTGFGQAGTPGVIRVTFVGASGTRIPKIFVEPTGKIITVEFDSNQISVRRLFPNGTADASFFATSSGPGPVWGLPRPATVALFEKIAGDYMPPRGTNGARMSLFFSFKNGPTAPSFPFRWFVQNLFFFETNGTWTMNLNSNHSQILGDPLSNGVGSIRTQLFFDPQDPNGPIPYSVVSFSAIVGSSFIPTALKSNYLGEISAGALGVRPLITAPQSAFNRDVGVSTRGDIIATAHYPRYAVFCSGVQCGVTLNREYRFSVASGSFPLPNSIEIIPGGSSQSRHLDILNDAQRRTWILTESALYRTVPFDPSDPSASSGTLDALFGPVPVESLGAASGALVGSLAFDSAGRLVYRVNDPAQGLFSLRRFIPQ